MNLRVLPFLVVSLSLLAAGLACAAEVRVTSALDKERLLLGNTCTFTVTVWHEGPPASAKVDQPVLAMDGIEPQPPRKTVRAEAGPNGEATTVTFHYTLLPLQSGSATIHPGTVQVHFVADDSSITRELDGFTVRVHSLRNLLLAGGGTLLAIGVLIAGVVGVRRRRQARENQPPPPPHPSEIALAALDGLRAARLRGETRDLLAAAEQLLQTWLEAIGSATALPTEHQRSAQRLLTEFQEFRFAGRSFAPGDAERVERTLTLLFRSRLEADRTHSAATDGLLSE